MFNSWDADVYLHIQYDFGNTAIWCRCVLLCIDECCSIENLKAFIGTHDKVLEGTSQQFAFRQTMIHTHRNNTLDTDGMDVIKCVCSMLQTQYL